MEKPRSHRYYLRCGFVVDELARTHFDDQEACLLEKYGAWLLALSKGWITPTTDGQIHFVACSRGEVDSTHQLEQLWWRHQNWLREVEARQQIERERVARGEANKERLHELNRICMEKEYAYEEAEEFAELWYEMFGEG